MDPNLNPGPNPVTTPADHPDHIAEVSAVKSWLRQNAVSLVITGAVIALVCIYLDPIDTLKVVFGLGLVIFIHELGHFLAAKFCDVHVKTFSIGFGPAVPFCSYKWGETTYMVGIIPLGGYVSMVGEGDAANEEEAEEDPRSFKHKSVGQRMVIISAGVVMNILLGMACFVAAYLHGVQEKPATVGWVESGSAAWRAGIRTDSDIKKIGSRENPFFNDIRPIVMSTLKNEQVPIDIEYQGSRTSTTVEPLRDEGVPFPQLGVAPPYRLTLLSAPPKRKAFRPTVPGTPAAQAEPRFEPGDRLVAMTDPEKYPEVTPFREDPHDPGSGKPDYNDYFRRMVLLADKPVTIRVLRKGTDGPPVDIAVQPAYRSDLGMRMRMGEVVALRKGGPAEAAGVVARPLDGPPARGDKIKVVKLPEPGGKQTWLAAGKVEVDEPNVTVRPLDPVLLPLELTRWAERNPADRTVRLVVIRPDGHNENGEAKLTLTFDPSFRFDREVINLPNTPLPVPGLGLAYWVEAAVNEVEPNSPAAEAGVQPNDVVAAVRFKALDANGNVVPGEWDDIKSHQWASAEAAFQSRPPHEIDLRLKRGDQTVEITLKGRPDKTWPTDDRGLIFQQDFRTQKATDIGHAVQLGAWRTVRFIKEVYQNLYAMIFGRVSPKTMSGPLTIANVSYRFAGEDFWQFLLFIGMISVNLAVVNFLPIPVLDGGHMVFLILEKILGRPVPERVFAIAMYTGLAMILALMIFVLTLDVRRLFFGWF